MNSTEKKRLASDPSNPAHRPGSSQVYQTGAHHRRRLFLGSLGRWREESHYGSSSRFLRDHMVSCRKHALLVHLDEGGAMVREALQKLMEMGWEDAELAEVAHQDLQALKEPPLLLDQGSLQIAHNLLQDDLHARLLDGVLPIGRMPEASEPGNLAGLEEQPPVPLLAWIKAITHRTVQD